jgi:hypothetical protein
MSDLIKKALLKTYELRKLDRDETEFFRGRIDWFEYVLTSPVYQKLENEIIKLLVDASQNKYVFYMEIKSLFYDYIELIATYFGEDEELIKEEIATKEFKLYNYDEFIKEKITSKIEISEENPLYTLLEVLDLLEEKQRNKFIYEKFIEKYDLNVVDAIEDIYLVDDKNEYILEFR